MPEANKKNGRLKGKGEIIQSAIIRIEGFGGYYKGELIFQVLMHLWETAFERGHAKGVKDERDRPKVTRVITRYLAGPLAAEKERK
jgi:hypothetical protein